MTVRTVRHLVPLLVAALSLPLAGCSDDSPRAAEPTTTSPASPASPESPSDSSSPTTAEPSSGSAPVSLREYEGTISPGRHRVPLISWDRTYGVDALLDVPDGFITPGGWVVENGQDGSAYGDLMFFGDVDRVNTDACGARRSVEPGPSVRDLADVLTAALVPQRTTTPKPVTIGGHHGLYVETTAPRDLSRCRDGQLTLWLVHQSDEFAYSSNQPGTVFHLWILDVDGQRVVVAVKVVPGHTTHAAELVHMAENAEFVKNVDG